MTILINRIPRALPTKLPDQSMTATGCTADDNPDLFKYNRGNANLACILESTSGTTSSFEKAEIQLWGYMEKSQKPSLIYSAEVDSSDGKLVVPMIQKNEVDYIVMRQASNSNIIGPTAGAFLLSSVPYPHSVTPADNIIVSVDGSANQTSIIDAAAATITCATSETYAVTSGMNLTFEIDKGDEQDVIFIPSDFVDPAVGTAEEIVTKLLVRAEDYVPSGTTDVTLTSNKKGIGSSVKITGGTLNTVLNFSTTIVSGTGDVADITAITFAEEKALFEADLSGVTLTLHTDYSGTYPVLTNDETLGSTGTLQVIAASTADAKIGFANTIVTGCSNTYNPACKYQLVYDDTSSIIV